MPSAWSQSTHSHTGWTEASSYEAHSAASPLSTCVALILLCRRFAECGRGSLPPPTGLFAMYYSIQKTTTHIAGIPLSTPLPNISLLSSSADPRELWWSATTSCSSSGSSAHPQPGLAALLCTVDFPSKGGGIKLLFDTYETEEVREEWAAWRERVLNRQARRNVIVAAQYGEDFVWSREYGLLRNVRSEEYPDIG